MRRHLYAPVLLATTVLLSLPSLVRAEADPLADIVAELTEKLELTEDQQVEVAGHLGEFAVALDAATATAEGDDESEDTAEPETLTAVKKARADFQGKMKKTLTKDQWKAYEAAIDAMMQEMFEDLAGIVIVDLVPVLELTEEQATALEPVLGSAMRGLIGVVVEYGDQKMNKRTKIKVAKSLKKIKGNLDAGLAEVLTPEQLEKYQAHKEAAAG